MPWDPAHRQIVTDLWVTGCGSARIIEALAAVGKVATKNAVICQAYRAGLAFQGARTKPPAPRPARVPLTPEERAERERARAARRRARDAAAPGRPVPPPRPRIERTSAPPSLRIPFWQTSDGECRYIADDPKRDSTCCGHPIFPGSRYCPAHHAECVQTERRPAPVFVPYRRIA
ncbi:MAG: hypothetical protein INR70_05065 [Parafilimonas terrae]|nr:hypothetical protein [Parafilimonas terrae]